MLYFGRIYVSEGTDVNKTSESKERDIFHYFLNKGLKFKANVCNGYHGLLVMPMNLNNIASLNIKGADYCCIIIEINQTWGYKLNAKYWFDQKKWNIIKHKFYHHT